MYSTSLDCLDERADDGACCARVTGIVTGLRCVQSFFLSSNFLPRVERKVTLADVSCHHLICFPPPLRRKQKRRNTETHFTEKQSKMESLHSTFVAALRSVATAGTMAMAGFYMHRRNLIGAEGKKALAKMSQQVTIPALFFSKIINCPQDFSDEPCPNVTDNLGDVWVLLLWPLYVVGCGLLVGDLMARISGTPRRQRKSVIAACAFANSTGLPVTLLTVIHANFPQTYEIGRVDPNLFLSVYLLLYPVLQWGIGGWLLTSPEVNPLLESSADGKSTIVQHVVNSTDLESNGVIHDPDSREKAGLMRHEGPMTSSDPKEKDEATETPKNVGSLRETVTKVLSKALQPPVIGALLGLFIASIPWLRGLFVDLQTRSDNAPLEWFFDGVYSVS